MVVEELSNGLYLDKILQDYILKVTAYAAGNYLLLDDNHSDENQKYFAHVCLSTTALKNKTIYNPPLTNGSGTDSTNLNGTGADVLIPVIGTTQYRVSFYRYKAHDLVRIQNLTGAPNGTPIGETFLFKNKDLTFWTNEINQIKKNYYS